MSISSASVLHSRFTRTRMVPFPGPTGLRAWLHAGLVVLAMLAVCQPAHAERDKQGPWARGTWLEGETLMGVKVAVDKGNSRRPVALELVELVGAKIKGRTWRPGRGWVDVELPATSLQGLRWREQRCVSKHECSSIDFRIVEARPDRSRNSMVEHGDNSDISLYRVEYKPAVSPAAGAWKNVCRTDHRGMAMGLFVPGRWNRDGSERAGGYTFVCTSGVIAKCARNWGYKPWKSLPAAGGQEIGLRPLHQACVRAARADYCGDGTSYTRDGTIVDLFDRHGFNRATGDPSFVDESAFDRHGARWIARLRWPLAALGRDAVNLPDTCQRLRALQTPPAITGTPDTARAAGNRDDDVLIYVRSRPVFRDPGR